MRPARLFDATTQTCAQK